MNVQDVLQVAATIVAGIGSAGFIILAFSGWLGKVWAARILEQDRLKYQSELERLKGELEARNRELQGEIDKTTYVHRQHFETEFRALRAIWRRIAKMRRDMSSLRPMFSIRNLDETRDDRFKAMEERFARFAVAFDAAINAVDDNRPFLTDELSAALERILKAAQAEHVALQLDPIGDAEGANRARKKDWYDEGRENYLAVQALLDEIVVLIRARLRTLAVYPD